MDHRRVFFVVFLAVQLLLPLTQMIVGPRPARFAWQMFSGSRAPIKIRIRTATDVKDVDVTNMVGNWRSDLSFEKHLPPFLCRRFPESSSVLLYYIESDKPREFPCIR